MNFLEQLAAEWYEYTGYFVRTNIRANKLPKGGWRHEIDVLAYDPYKSELIHIETTGGTESWEKIEKSIEKKFSFNMNDYEKILRLTKINKIRKIIICGWSKKIPLNHKVINGVDVQSIPEFLNQVLKKLHEHDFLYDSVPEGFPILRTIQMMDKFQDLSDKDK